MWSDEFRLNHYATYVQVYLNFGMNRVESQFDNETHAIMDSYKRVRNHAWEMCKMVESMGK